uniref:lysine histidine transporter-like 8 n=1 Tax=Erigeron canadensis TaxID=72917 RepID=UPI001CB96F35|nr:lysine histidine transporter-like 8 [Erigeron canadensis]
MSEEVPLENRIFTMNDEVDIIISQCNNSTSESGKPDSKEIRNGINTPLDDWLPITKSRKGNLWATMFHLLCSGIGIQTLALPLSFVYLGWFRGIMCLSVAFSWQLYTIWLLVSLHESVPDTRYSRYVQLSIAAFGIKLGKLLAIFPVMYLSGGTCVMLIITGGGTMKLLYQLLCDNYSSKHPLTTTQWFLVFICLAILISTLCPSMHSLALVSFLGATMAVGYCTMLWIVFVTKGMIHTTTSHDPTEVFKSEAGRIRNVLNALGIIALTFRGHNVVLEIQSTIPSTMNFTSSKIMLKGVAGSNIIRAMCFFPLAIVGYWAFGNEIPTDEGFLIALSSSLYHHMSKPLLSLVYIQVVISCLTAFQIYSMVVYDNLESAYANRKSKKCPKVVRIGIRIFFGGLTFFISVVFPFLPSLALVIGGISLPLTFSYPCLMWIRIKKQTTNYGWWWINLGLGCLGIGLSVILTVGGVWNLASKGLDANFFHPH